MDVLISQQALKVPEHLNRQLFEKAIRSYEKDSSAKVLDFSVSSGANAGDNFGSQIFRVKIKFSSKYRKEAEISTIVKTIEKTFNLAGLSDFDKQKTAFVIEAEIYGKVLPDMKDLLKESFWPGLIYQELDPLPVIILDDVFPRGFDKIISTPPEDFEVSKLIVKKLAKFHAASFYLQNEQKYDFSHLNQTYHSDDAVSEMLVGKTMKGLVEFLRGKEDFEEFIPSLEHFRDNHQKMTLESYKVSKGTFSFNVLNHADFHTKNVLWKVGKDEKIEDVCVLDFQICYFGTPAIDLAHALYFFLSNKNRETRRDEFIAVYHAQFVESLKSFGYLKSIPSLLDLQVELLKNGNLQAMIGLAYTIGLYFDMKSITMEDLANLVGLANKIFSAVGYQEILKMDLPRFVCAGML